MKVLLVALNAKFIHSSLALRCLYAYAKEYKDYIELSEYTINQQEDFILQDIFIRNPEVVGFSCYLWNINEIRRITKNLKKVLPKIRIFWGGPEVSFDAKKVLSENPDVEFVIRGEGESTFQEVMGCFLQKEYDLSHICGVTWRKGNFITENPLRDPISLNDLPFIYENLTGLENRIIYYETQRGCPYQCQYCLSSVDKGVRFLSESRCKKDLKFFLDHHVRQVKFVDRTFNCNKNHALEIWRYLMENDNGITNFHMEITADLLDDETIAVLKNARPGLFQFEIGVQSTNSETIHAVKRNTSFQTTRQKVMQVYELGNIHVHLDLIAGLPYEDYESFGRSLNDVYELRPQQFQLGFLKLLKGSGLRRDSDRYGIVYREEAPYEVLYTKEISFKEMLLLKGIEEMIELYYNSGKAWHSLLYFVRLFQSPFRFYETFASYWVEHGHHIVQHGKMELYEILFSFIKSQNFGSMVEQITRDLLRFDIYCCDPMKNIPSCFIEPKTEERKGLFRYYYNNPEFRKENKMEDYTPAQLNRMCHGEIFSFDISLYCKTGKVLEKTTAAIFDYRDRDAMFGHGTWIEVPLREG